MKFPWDKENIKKISYPDGSSYVEVESFLPQIEFRINSYEDLWTLTQIKDVYDYNNMQVCNGNKKQTHGYRFKFK